MAKLFLIKNRAKDLTFEEVYEIYKRDFYYRFKNYTWLERDDAIQIASIGLYKAYIKYDITQGYDFSTFAARCIDMEFKNTVRKRLNEDKNIEENHIAFLNIEDSYKFSEKVKIKDVIKDEVDDYKQVLDRIVIESAMKRLNQNECSTIIDIYFKDLSLDYISKKERISKKGVAKRKNEALRKMRRYI